MNFTPLLIDWYKKHKRDLPWRHTTHPYPIWISEIILQQTRVQQGLPYFEKFMTRFPTVFDIANASEQDVLNLWQGLGYYSRARNLHKGTQQIVFDLKGNFPDNFSDWLKIKGVGSYTAAAIASFAFNEPVPAVDGNVFRVLSRFFDIDMNIALSKAKKYFFDFSKELIDKNNPGLYNQAIMEFGALHCVPNRPDCATCVLQNGCISFSKKIVNERPVKIKTKRITKRFFHYFVITDRHFIYLQQRKKKDIWLNMFEFPLIEENNDGISVEHLNKYGISDSDIYLIKASKKHILSHQEIYIKFWSVTPAKANKLLKDSVKIPLKETKNYPMPKPVFAFIDEFFN